VSLDFTEVTASDVGRHFGRRKALSQISFECRAGEVLGLLGPNGAGKSTLIAILATLLAPSTGRVTYGGQSIREAGADLRSKLGLLGHELYLYPELTARENLLFFARLYGLADPVERTAAGLEVAGLTDRADDQVLSFSRGMRQRLALERALIHSPRLLLLDEPFTGLDQASASALVERLLALKRSGCLIVLATHDLEIAEGVLSRALYLRNGRLVAQDEGTAGLRERYHAAITAS
jgi:heme exporter protein A